MCECSETERELYLDRIMSLDAEELNSEIHYLIFLKHSLSNSVPIKVTIDNRLNWISEYQKTLKLLGE